MEAQLGFWDEALSDLHKQLEINPNNAQAIRALPMVLLPLGRASEALQYWHEATLLMPGLEKRVPVEALAQLKRLPDSSADPIWQRVSPSDGIQFGSPDAEGETHYYFVLTKPNGTPQLIRNIDASDEKAGLMQDSLRYLAFPQVRVKGKRIPTAHIVKVVKEAGGENAIFRSVAPEAIRIAKELSPQEFPDPLPPP